MLHSYLRINDRLRTQKQTESITNKVGEMFVDIGPSMTITFLTNALGFAIGTITPTPEIQLFCIATGTAIIAEFIVCIFAFYIKENYIYFSFKLLYLLQI